MRQRAKKACLQCRRRKRKCDGQFPCRNCHDYEYHCVFDQPGTQGDGPNEALSRGPDMPSQRNPSSMEPQSHRPISSANGSVHESTHSIGRTRGFLDPHKSRYLNKESSVSFPRSLALKLQTSQLPRLHAFAYHAGIRSEPAFTPQHSLIDLVTLPQAQNLFGIYKTVIQPVLGFLDLDVLNHQCEEYWNGKAQGEAFEAIVCGVFALASLFSGFLTQYTEAQIVDHAKTLLESPFYVSPPNLHWVMAWTLRTIYLRATSRPHIAWMCSCITMHVAEAIGLHRSAEEVTLVINTGRTLFEEGVDTRERTFQVARSLNLIISYDYGRSSVSIGKFIPTSLTPRLNDFTVQFCSLVGGITSDDTNASVSVESTDLLCLLEKVHKAPADHDFVILTKAELAWCIYRRLHHFGYALEEEKVDQLLDVGVPALQAALRLATAGLPWWNILGTVFHFVCVLLSINTNRSLERLPEVVQTLEQLAQHLDTHMAREAAETANDLVRASLDKNQRRVQSLETALACSATNVRSHNTTPKYPEFDWNMFLQPFDQNRFQDIAVADMLQDIEPMPVA